MRTTAASRRLLFTLSIPLLFLQLAGCSSPMDGPYQAWLDKDPDQWQDTNSDTLHQRDTLLGQTIEAKSEQSPEDGPWLKASPDVEAYVHAALNRNPAIRSAKLRVARMEARIDQVTSLDDPMFQIAPVGEMAQTATGQVGLMTGLSQKLPFPGKLKTRGHIAEQNVAMAKTDVQATRLRIAAQTRQAYWRYYYATQAIKNTKESQSLLIRYKDTAEVQYETGKRSQGDALRATLEVGKWDNQLVILAQQQATTRGMLNQLMDRPINAPLPEPAPSPATNSSQDLETLLAQAAIHNPDILKIHQRIEQYREYRKLANLTRWPDVTASINYNAVEDHGRSAMANGKDQWWLGLGVNLPVWFKKYDAQESEALQGLLENIADLTSVHNRVAYEVQDAWLRIQAQQKLIDTFEKTLIPQAKQSLDASTSSYNTGTEDFLTLIDSWKKVLDFKLLYQRALVDRELAAADLQQAIGQDVQHQP